MTWLLFNGVVPPFCMQPNKDKIINEAVVAVFDVPLVWNVPVKHLVMGVVCFSIAGCN